ncbi:MAG TPA: protein kinase [Bryobacteraceae bacterium]|nr:protein kinase [Bryobacteraceae bacterium]
MGTCVTSRYEILEKIGEGGYGIVYKARDLHVSRLVALKFIDPQLLDSPDMVRRFQDEARAVSLLNHPNIVVLHDFDMDPETGSMFHVLEYLPGGTLKELIERNRTQGLQLPAGEILRCATSMAAGLAHACRRGVIHRDVKSSNVMFSEERVVKITDFGLAKAECLDRSTDPGRFAGTLCYMSPEQARGVAVDHRTDIFSLGVVVYEMATGSLPFKASNPYDILRQVVSEPTPPIVPSRLDLPDDLDRIVRRATAKEPSERYQRMEEMERDLLAVQDRLKTFGESPTAPLVPLRRPRRVLRRTVLAAALGVVLTVAVSGTLWHRASRELPAPLAPAPRTVAVVPFQCLGSDESHAVFCEGLANTLSSMLTRMEAYQDSIRVVPYSEVRREGVASAADAHRLFKAQLALTGSVEFIGTAVRVNINVVDARQKLQTASSKLDSSTGSLARLQDDISTLAGGMLGLRLTPANQQRVAAGQTRNEAAFDAYVRGLGYLGRGNEIEDVRRAIAMLEEAVRLDPGYALAHAHLADAYVRQYRRTEDGRWVDRARESCERALQLNDRLAEPHITSAELYLARAAPEKAIEHLKTALALEPKSADALRMLGNAYSSLAVRTGDPARHQEALATFKEAIALRPELWTTYRDLGLAYVSMGDYRKAEEQLRRMLEFTESADAYRNLGAVYHRMDRSEDAIACFRKSIAIKPTPEAYSNLGTVCYYLKRYEEVIPNFENALRLSEETRTRNHVIWGNLAMAYMRTPGMQAKGRDALRQAIRIAEAKLRASPGHADTHVSLAYYLVRAGDGDGALRHAARALELAPDRASVLFRASLVYERLGRREQALEALGRAIGKGHPLKEVLNAGDLEALRADVRFQPYLAPGK